MDEIDQIKYEHDKALQQLNEVGLTLGQRTDNVVRVVRCKNCKYWEKETTCCLVHGTWHDKGFYCADGKLDFSTIEGCCV